MKCQILFSGKNKKEIINLLSAESAQRVVMVKALSRADYITFFFSEKVRLEEAQ